jgi:hypothetical protein
MDSRERVRLALDHQESDHVPFDLGGTGLSTIHLTAYQNLRQHLGPPQTEARIGFVAEQLVLVDEDVAERLQTDVRPVLPGTASTFEYVFRDEGEYEAYTGDVILECTATGPDPFTPVKGEGWLAEVRQFTKESLRLLNGYADLAQPPGKDDY